MPSMRPKSSALGADQKAPENSSEVRAFQPAQAALLDDADEHIVHVALDGLEPLDVVRLLGLEGIERALVGAGRVNAPLDAELLDGLDEAEACRDDADGADDGRRVGIDFIAGDGQVVAARGRDVLAEDVDLLVLFLSELTDAAEDEARLDGRAAGGIDHDGDGRCTRKVEGLLDGTGEGREGNAGPERRGHADGPGQPQDRNDGAAREWPHMRNPFCERTACELSMGLTQCSSKAAGSGKPFQ